MGVTSGVIHRSQQANEETNRDYIEPPSSYLYSRLGGCNILGGSVWNVSKDPVVSFSYGLVE